MARKRRWLLVFWTLGLSTVLLFLLSLANGSVDIPLFDVARALLGKDVAQASIVTNIRLPRTLSAVIGGTCLATAGLLLQIFFGNPIVEPYVLGISSGATLFVGLVVLGGFTFGFRNPPPMFLFAGAFLGSMLVMLLIILAARRVKNITTLLIIGIMVGFLCSAVTRILTAFADKEKLHGFAMWSMGSFSGFSWNQVRFLYLIAVPALVLTIFISKPLNAMLMGESYASTMGLDVRQFRIVLVTISSVLTAVITAFAGPISFIGLAVPHMMRITLKTTDSKILLPGVALGGAMLTLFCDLIARTLVSPIELPLGAVTSFIGTPLVVFLLMRKEKKI